MSMTRQTDGVYGIAELLDPDILGCDGLFLDTVDTVAPNSYTAPGSFPAPGYEWTAPGYHRFLSRLRSDYPDALLAQNRGLFLFDPRLAHYRYNPAALLDFIIFECYSAGFAFSDSASSNDRWKWQVEFPTIRQIIFPTLRGSLLLS